MDQPSRGKLTFEAFLKPKKLSDNLKLAWWKIIIEFVLFWSARQQIIYYFIGNQFTFCLHRPDVCKAMVPGLTVYWLPMNLIINGYDSVSFGRDWTIKSCLGCDDLPTFTCVCAVGVYECMSSIKWAQVLSKNPDNLYCCLLLSVFLFITLFASMSTWANITKFPRKSNAN